MTREDMRHAALKLAIEDSCGALSSADVVARAQAFLAFLEGGAAPRDDRAEARPDGVGA